MFHRLPPAGNPIVWRSARSAPHTGEPLAPWSVRYYGSGTQALAAALRTRPEGRNRILLPAYGCPDLLAAVVHAGATPVLVDLEHDTPWMDPDAVARAVDQRTGAVIAIDLFGIPERCEALRARLPESQVMLVRDAAQALPPDPAQECADLVVLSFGRGKPVSLLGGGAVLAGDRGSVDRLPAAAPVPDDPLRFRLRALAYNLLSHPRCYWLPALLPLGLGETRYRPLDKLTQASTTLMRALDTNLDARRRAPRLRYRELIPETLASLERAGGVDLPARLGLSADTALLRYPLLAADARQRDQLLAALEAAGLGATSLYGRILPEIDGVPGELDLSGDYPNARRFAERLLTLPMHERMTPALVRRIGRVIDREVAA